jgi:hypothetical protein
MKDLIWYGSIITAMVCFSQLSLAARWTPPPDEKPSFKFGVVGTSLMVDISDPEGVVKTPVEYRPNSLGRLTFGVAYLGFGATAGITTEREPEDEAQFGRTTGMDYQFRFFREQNSFDLFYQKYTGFYVENSKDIDPTIQGTDPFMQQSDMHSEHLGLQYFRTLSPEDFSMAACFEQNGWQKESGGTWFGYAAVDQHHLESASSLIPTQLLADYASIQDFRSGNFTTGKIGFGGAYVFVYNKYYLVGKLIVAMGQQKQKYELSGEKIDRLVPTSGGNAKVSMGYNGDTFFTSLNVFNDATSIAIKDRQINMGTLEVSLFFGTHL